MRASLRRIQNIGALERTLAKNGWSCREGRHQVWKCGCGDHMVTLPRTVKGDRALKNYAKHVDRQWCVSN